MVGGLGLGQRGQAPAQPGGVDMAVVQRGAQRAVPTPEFGQQCQVHRVITRPSAHSSVSVPPKQCVSLDWYHHDVTKRHRRKPPHRQYGVTTH